MTVLSHKTIQLSCNNLVDFKQALFSLLRGWVDLGRKVFLSRWGPDSVTNMFVGSHNYFQIILNIINQNI